MNGNLTSTVYRRVQASEASAVVRSLLSASHTPLVLHGGAARWRRSPPPRPFGGRGALSRRTTQINNPARPAPCACPLNRIPVSKQRDPRVAKAGGFFHVVVF